MSIALPDKQVIQYIPQRAPIVMIDTLVDVVGGITETALTISTDTLFVQNGLLHEPGLIENIAQTAAAGVGYACALKKETVPVGFIGAIKNLTIHQLPKVDAALVLLYLEDLSYREMAEVLGLSESNVGVKLNRARKALAELMSEVTYESR